MKLKNWKVWKSTLTHPDAKKQCGTRPFTRATVRAKIWAMVSGQNALRDDRGIIPRKVRRNIALLQFKSTFKKIREAHESQAPKTA